MPIVGEQVFWHLASAHYDEDYRARWELKIPPSSAMVKVSLSHFIGWHEHATAQPYIISICRRKPDGTDEQINFPDDYLHIQQAYFDHNITNVKFGLYLWHCVARVMTVIEYWD